MSPDWPNRSTPSGTTTLPRDRAEPRQRRRVAVADRHQRGAGPQPRQQPLGDADLAGAPAPPASRGAAAPGEVIASSPAPGTSSRARRGRRAPPARPRRNRRSPARRPAPARAANRRRRRSPRRAPASSVALGLVDRPGRQPEIDRTRRPRAGFPRTPSAAAPPARRHRPARTPVSPGWPMPISGSIDRLVRAALRRQRDARRRRHQDEARILVAARSSAHRGRA